MEIPSLSHIDWSCLHNADVSQPLVMRRKMLLFQCIAILYYHATLAVG